MQREQRAGTVGADAEGQRHRQPTPPASRSERLTNPLPAVRRLVRRLRLPPPIHLDSCHSSSQRTIGLEALSTHV